MPNDTATIYCPNHTCQTPNPETHKFCQKCRTALPKRYLWAVGSAIETYKPGDLLGDRYLLKSQRILLDTAPGLLPKAPVEISEAVIPYLKLVAEQLHLPQVYAVLPGPERHRSEIVLLENAPLDVASLEAEQRDRPTDVLPALVNAWKTATALRQLNWLWQIAQLWFPLSAEGVASSLLNPNLLRVEGSLVRLLELQFDTQAAPTLAQLGQVWLQWIPAAQPSLAPFLEHLCQHLIQGRIQTAEQLIGLLDQGLAVCGRSQSRQIQIVTRTDQGPSRQRNEDACYPPSGTTLTDPEALVIVCDGIGGHEGGNVASNLAIEAIQQQLQPLPLKTLDPATLSLELERSACAANNLISQRNDDEQRQERQRMGTTLVMALAHAHELYITHVGDSRAYWITRTGCYQVTLDDDVAAREVRLGYSLYRDALQQSAAGSLVQALGMGPSSTLYPTVQRFVLDEDSVFLLCSDGLSDHDRVEEYWETEVLPVLNGTLDLATAGQRLIEIANTRNGHDNVTIGLVYCHLTEGVAEVPAEALAQLAAVPPPDLAQAAGSNLPTSPHTTASTLKTQILPSKTKRTSSLPLLLGIVLLLGLGGVLVYLLIPSFGKWIDPLIGRRSGSESGQAGPSVEASPTPKAAVAASLTAGSLLQIERSTVNTSAVEANLVVLRRQPQRLPTATTTPAAITPSPTTAATTPAVEGVIPAGSILKVIRKQETPEQGNWLQLRVCSIPGTAIAETQPSEPTSNPASPAPASSAVPSRLLSAGETGWIQETVIAPLVVQNPTIRPDQLGACAAASASPTPDTTATPSVPRSL